MDDKLTVLIVRPNEKAQILEIENAIERFEELIGVQYEVLEFSFLNCKVFYNYYATEKNITFLGVELNGTVIFTGSTITGEVVSLPNEDIPMLKRNIRYSN